jgi:hypothetical protein
VARTRRGAFLDRAAENADVYPYYPPSVQGFPISFSVDGKQYVAVATGLGGGSPRQVPATITPEIRPQLQGHALYVFTLPDAPVRAGRH